LSPLALEPVLTLHLFPEERLALLDLLKALTEDEWGAATVCKGWSVKDIAAHLFADDLGRLSRGRDGFAGAELALGTDPERFDAELLAAINRQNELWVDACRRLSPRVLIELLRWSGGETQSYFESLDMYAVGEPVTWAGPEPAPVWLDVAREFTERWLHQQQIRDAVSRPGLYEPRIFEPVLDTFVRALPHTFRDRPAPDGTQVRLVITGDAGEEWSLVRREGGWSLCKDAGKEAAAIVTLDGDTAWRVFTKGISKEEALARATITGDSGLGEKVLDTVSIIA